MTGNNVELAYVDQGYIEPNAAAAAQQHGLRLEVAKHPMARRGFVLLPRRSQEGLSAASPYLMTESKPDVSDKDVKTAPA